MKKTKTDNNKSRLTTGQKWLLTFKRWGRKILRWFKDRAVAIQEFFREVIRDNKRYFEKLRWSNIRRFFQELTWAKVKSKLHELRWTKIDGYIMKRFLLALFGSLILFVSIYLLTLIFQDLRYIPTGTPGWLLVQHYVSVSMYWILILQPFSFLFASVYVLSTMANTRELVAIVSTGTSLYRTSFYMVLFTVVYYLLMVGVLENKVIFPAYQRGLILKKVILKQASMEQLDRLKDNHNFSIFGGNDLLYIVGNYNAMIKELKNITVVQFEREGSVKSDDMITLTNQNLWLTTNINELKKRRNLLTSYRIKVRLRADAEKAIWNPQKKQWIFYNTTVRYVKGDAEDFKIEKFNNQPLEFVKDTPDYFEQIWYPVDAMTYKESRQYVDRLKKSHQDYREAEASYISKFSYPMGVILVALVAVGIVNIGSRKGSLIMNLGVSVALFLVYYLFFAAGRALAGKGMLSPQVGAYAGTVVFAVVSGYLYMHART